MNKSDMIRKFLTVVPRKKKIANFSKEKPYGYGKSGKYNA